MNMRTLILSLSIAALALPMISAEEPVATSMKTATAERMVGSWLLSFEVFGEEQQIGLKVADVNGYLGATLDSPDQPEPRALDIITPTTDGVDFQFEMPFEEMKLIMHLKLKESAGLISGVLREENGLFETQVKGEEGTLDVDPDHRASPTEARLNLENGKVRITFGNLPSNGKDHAKLDDLEQGAVFRFTGSRATKLFTDADLRFGDALIRKENVAPNYPGVYSLWLKRTAQGWALLVNEQPDVWGTQHDPAFDVAEIPLSVSTLDKTQDELLITLKQEDEGDAVMRLAWGDTAWTTTFQPAQ